MNGSNPLTFAQRRVLHLVATTAPDRLSRSWVRAGRSLGPVLDPVSPPPGTEGIRFERLSDGGEEAHVLRGARERQAYLPLCDLPALAPFWAEPLVSLNAAGLKIAREPVEPPLLETFRLEGVGQGVKLGAAVLGDVRQACAALGLDKSSLYRLAIVEFLERRGMRRGVA